MIVNIKDVSFLSKLKNLIMFSFKLYRSLFSFQVIGKLYLDSKKLDQSFRHKYPRLVKTDEAIKCVSCGLCEEICPSQSIKIEKGNMVNFPKSLKAGEAPLHFYLNTDTCTKCNLCADICIVNALELKESYDESHVDLVKPKRLETNPGVKESSD